MQGVGQMLSFIFSIGVDQYSIKNRVVYQKQTEVTASIQENKSKHTIKLQTFQQR